MPASNPLLYVPAIKFSLVQALSFVFPRFCLSLAVCLHLKWEILHANTIYEGEIFHGLFHALFPSILMMKTKWLLFLFRSLSPTEGFEFAFKICCYLRCIWLTWHCMHRRITQLLKANLEPEVCNYLYVVLFQPNLRIFYFALEINIYDASELFGTFVNVCFSASLSCGHPHIYHRRGQSRTHCGKS